MPADAIAVVNEFWEAWNARDVERAAAVIGANAELRPMRAQLEGKAYIGHDGFRQVVADVDEDWESLRIVVERQEAHGEQVAQLTRLQGRGRVSGVDLDVPVGWHAKVRDGKLIYVRAYSNPEDAFEAARA